jgi:hypothetical protein
VLVVGGGDLDELKSVGMEPIASHTGIIARIRRSRKPGAHSRQWVSATTPW